MKKRIVFNSRILPDNFLVSGAVFTLVFTAMRSLILKTFLFVSAIAALPLIAEEKPADMRTFIDGELAAGKKEIVVPKGRYYTTPKDGTHLWFKNLSDVTVKAYGAELICTQTIAAIRIENCKNLRIEGLVIDYDPLPYTQGKIVSMSDDKMNFEVEIFEGYGDVKNIEWGDRLEIFDQNTRRLKVNTYGGYKLEKLSDMKFRLTKPEWARQIPFQNEEVGDIIALSMPSSEHAGGHGVYCTDSKGVVFKDVTMYSSPAFGFWEGECDANVYDNVKITRRDTGDFKKRANPRIRSLNADGFHSTAAIKGPTFLNCETGWNGDDSIAINGLYYLVYSGDSSALRVAARGNKFGFTVGDRIEIYRPDGSVKYAKITSIKKSHPVTKEEMDWFKTQRVYPAFIKWNTFFQDAYEIALDAEIDIPRRSMILNTAKMGNGFKIKGGKFGNNRSRGLIIKSGNGVIDGATIEAAWMESIKIAPEWFWFEGGHTENLTIKNCKILCGSGPAISINSPAADEKTFSEAGANNNIKIINNTFKYVSMPVVFATSVNDLKMAKNKFDLMDEGFYVFVNPSHMGVECSEPVKLINCQQKD